MMLESLVGVLLGRPRGRRGNKGSTSGGVGGGTVHNVVVVVVVVGGGQNGGGVVLRFAPSPAQAV